MAIWDSFLSERDVQLIELSGYGGRDGFGARPALLVIDATVNFCGEEREDILVSVRKWRRSCGAQGWDAVPSISRLLAAARDAGVPVIYSTGVDAPGRPVFAGRRADKNRRGSEDAGAARSGGNEIVAPIAPLPDEIVLRKTKPSIFFGTPLLSYLIDLKVDTLVCCGGTTSGCVRASVVDAFSHNYRVAVVEEATFDRVPAAHAMNLFDIDLKYGDVVSLPDAERYLRSCGASSAELDLAGASA